MQHVRIVIGGKIVKKYVCTKCLKAGKITKAPLVKATKAPV